MNAIFRKLDVNYDKLDQYNASMMVSEARWTIIIGETVHNRTKQECRAGQTGHVPRAPPPLPNGALLPSPPHGKIRLAAHVSQHYIYFPGAHTVLNPALGISIATLQMI